MQMIRALKENIFPFECERKKTMVKKKPSRFGTIGSGFDVVASQQASKNAITYNATRYTYDWELLRLRFVCEVATTPKSPGPPRQRRKKRGRTRTNF